MTQSPAPIRVLSAGLGNMGRSHALAYHENPGFEIAGLVNRSKVELPEALTAYEILPSFPDALKALKPDLCSINTYSDSHADYAVMAMEAGAAVAAHVEGLRAAPGVKLLLTDVGFDLALKSGAVVERHDLMHGVALPDPDASWPWPVAPFGELDPAYQALHKVVAVRF